MSRNTYISIALCLAGTAGLFGWMFSNTPLKPLPKVKSVVSLGQKTVTKPSGKVIFNVPRSKATALNDVPVNIVINSGVNAIPVQNGVADLVVISSGLRMRAEPTSQSPELGKYPKGARFAHIRDERGWALVQSLDDGQKGWMFRKYMGKEG